MNNNDNNIGYELKEFIKLALQYYDEQNYTYRNIITTKKVKFDLINDVILLNNQEFSFQVLGYFDNQTNIWIWSWVLPDLNYEKTQLARDLLFYGLKLEPSTNSTEHFIIRSLLVNSRILLEDFIQLDTYLAIISFIIKDKILFIYHRIRYLNDNNYITIYYLINK